MYCYNKPLLCWMHLYLDKKDFPIKKGSSGQYVLFNIKGINLKHSTHILVYPASACIF